MKELERKINESIEEHKQRARSAWERGVMDYVKDLFNDLLESLEFNEIDLKEYAEKVQSKSFDARLRDGASNWNVFSWGGCSLVYDEDIAKRLCTPKELRRTKNGMNRPNSREDWLDVQGRALAQAAPRLFWILKGGL